MFKLKISTPKNVYMNKRFKDLLKELQPYITTLPDIGESTLDEQEQMMYILTNRKIPIVRKGIVHLYTREWYEPASHNTFDRILSHSHKISNLELEHVKLTDDYYVNFNYLEEE